MNLRRICHGSVPVRIMILPANVGLSALASIFPDHHIGPNMDSAVWAENASMLLIMRQVRERGTWADWTLVSISVIRSMMRRRSSKFTPPSRRGSRCQGCRNPIDEVRGEKSGPVAISLAIEQPRLLEQESVDLFFERAENLRPQGVARGCRLLLKLVIDAIIETKDLFIVGGAAATFCGAGSTLATWYLVHGHPRFAIFHLDGREFHVPVH